MLLIILSNQLWIVGLVGHYPTNYLIQRGPILPRNSFPRRAYTVLNPVSRDYSVEKGTFPRVTNPSATKPEGFVRLACVRPAASVRSEPGSNSQVEMPEGISLTFEPLHIIHCLTAFGYLRTNPNHRKPQHNELLLFLVHQFPKKRDTDKQ